MEAFFFLPVARWLVQRLCRCGMFILSRPKVAEEDFTSFRKLNSRILCPPSVKILVSVFPLSFLPSALAMLGIRCAAWLSKAAEEARPLWGSFMAAAFAIQSGSSGKRFLGLVAQFLASGVSLSCPYLKKSISPAQRVQENPYLCARLRSHKRSYLLLGSRTPFYFGFLFCQKQGASAFGIRPLCFYNDLIIFFFVSSLTFRYRDIALLPSAWPLIDAMSESLKPAS